MHDNEDGDADDDDDAADDNHDGGDDGEEGGDADDSAGLQFFKERRSGMSQEQSALNRLDQRRQRYCTTFQMLAERTSMHDGAKLHWTDVVSAGLQPAGVRMRANVVAREKFSVTRWRGRRVG